MFLRKFRLLKYLYAQVKLTQVSLQTKLNTLSYKAIISNPN